MGDVNKAFVTTPNFLQLNETTKLHNTGHSSTVDLPRREQRERGGEQVRGHRGTEFPFWNCKSETDWQMDRDMFTSLLTDWLCDVSCVYASLHGDYVWLH